MKDKTILMLTCMSKNSFYKVSFKTALYVMVASWACNVTEILTQRSTKRSLFCVNRSVCDYFDVIRLINYLNITIYFVIQH